jgi:hypothetical protein
MNEHSFFQQQLSHRENFDIACCLPDYPSFPFPVLFSAQMGGEGVWLAQGLLLSGLDMLSSWTIVILFCRKTAKHWWRTGELGKVNTSVSFLAKHSNVSVARVTRAFI